MSEGARRIARAIRGEAEKRSRRLFPDVMLGTIKAGLVLELDGFAHGFETDDYLVDERFTYPDPFLSGGGHSQESGSGVHDHDLPDHLRNLTVGDRVLCAILDADSEGPTPYVIGRLPS